MDCQSGLLLCPGGAFNSTLGTKYEVVHSSMFFLPEGFHITTISQPGFYTRPADIVAIGTVEKIGAHVMSTGSEGNAFVFNSGHLDVGDILLGDGNGALQEIHHRFDLVVIYLPPATMSLSLGKFPVGNWNQTGTIKTEVTHFIITASVSITNVTWIVPYFVPTNESFNITTLPHPGHNVTYRIRIANENASFTKYNQSEWEFFYIWTNISNQSLPMLLDKKGQFTVVLTAVNLLSSSMSKCQLVVMDPIKHLYLFNVTATALGNNTEISWIVERGTNVTYNISFGDGKFIIGSFSTLAIFVGSYFHKYGKEGTYNVTLTAYNALSTKTVTGVADVQRSIKGLNISTKHTGGDAGYGAPGRGPNKTDFPVEYEVLFVAGISDGSAVNYRWDFGDGTPPIETKNTSILHRFFDTKPFNVTLGSSNSISGMNVSGVVTMMQSILNVSFENDSPTVFEFNTTFTIAIGQRGTDSCFLVDLGNNTRILYKGFQNVSCDNELKRTNDTKVLPSLNFTILFQYLKKTRYAVNLTAMNSVSNVTLHGWVIILPLPCKFPVVRIPDAGRTLETRIKYFRAEYISIKSRCTIDCLASRETTFQWNLIKVSSGDDNGTILETDDFDKTLSVLIIPRRTLPYGTFLVKLNVSMVGLPLVHTIFDSYLEIMPSPLVAALIGGNNWIQSVYKRVIIDASPSHDPDYGLEDKQGLKYIWYCKTTDEKDYDFPSVPDEYGNRTNASGGGGCLRNGTRRLMVNTEVLEIEPAFLRSNTSYIFKLFIAKDSREPVVVLVRVGLTVDKVPTMVIK